MTSGLMLPFWYGDEEIILNVPRGKIWTILGIMRRMEDMGEGIREYKVNKALRASIEPDTVSFYLVGEDMECIATVTLKEIEEALGREDGE